MAKVRQNMAAIPVLNDEQSAAFKCVQRYVTMKVMPATLSQTLANINRTMGIMNYIARKEHQANDDLFEVPLKIDFLPAAVSKLEKTGDMPSTLIKYLRDYRYVPTAYEIRFDDSGMPDLSGVSIVLSRPRNYIVC